MVKTARRAGQRLRKLESNHRSVPERRLHPEWRPSVGERIRLLALDKAAEVLEVSDDGQQLSVRCGVMRSMVDLQSVESLDGRRAAPPEKPVVQVKARRGVGGSQVRTARNTVDVRGQRVHEAEAAVEELLRGANGPVWVIHGIGTGRLKRGLRQWLDSLLYVERVVDADQGDGGPGCSVVWVR